MLESANYNFVRPDYTGLGNSFAQGAQTGIGLGSLALQSRQMREQKKTEQPPNMPISEPGERPQLDPNKAFGGEEKDLRTINEFWKNSKNIDPEDKQNIYSELETKILKTDLGKNVARAVMTGQMKLEDANKLLNKVKSGTATEADIALFKGQLKSAGINPQIVDSKMNEVQSTQQRMNEDYDNSVKSTLNSLLKYYGNPDDYAYKGQVDDSVARTVQNEKNYMAELGKNPENLPWIKDYLQTRQQIMRGRASGGSGGYKPADYTGFYIDKDGKEKQVSGSGHGPEEFMSKHKDKKFTKIVHMENNSMITDFLLGGLGGGKNHPETSTENYPEKTINGKTYIKKEDGKWYLK